MAIAYIAIKFLEDFGNDKIVEAIEKALNKKSIKGSCIIRDYEQVPGVNYTASQLMEQALKMIDESDFMIVEFSEKGVGLGIEAGYAYAKGKPILVLARVGSDISKTIEGISNIVCFYDNESQIDAVLSKAIDDVNLQKAS